MQKQTPAYEAKIYQTLWDYLPGLRGLLKFRRCISAELARKYFSFQFRFVEGAHLFPFEKPRETAIVIKEIIKHARLI